MKNRKIKGKRMLRPLLLVSAVGIACQSIVAQAAPTIASTPFANRPLHLQNDSTQSSVPGVKPNIMFMIDDSGSMGSGVPGSGVPGRGLTRMQVTKDALTTILNTYQDRMRWNIYTLWGTEQRPVAWRGVAHPFMTAAQMQPLVDNLRPAGWTPTTMRYLEASRELKEGIQYRCQKNYMVVMSDGDANGGAGAPHAGLPGLLPWESVLYGNFTNGRPPAQQNVWDGLSEYTRMPSRNSYRTYDQGLNNGIALFSHILAGADLKKDSDGRDIEGGYWDENTTDPDPVMRNINDAKQSISTFTIGFGSGLSVNGENYLVDAATCGTSKSDKEGSCYFAPTTGAQLSQAFDKIFKSIDAENKPTAKQTYSASTPSTTGSTIAELAATLTLDTGKWSSQLLFAKFNNGTLTNDTVSATYNNRKVLVNDGNSTAGSIYWLDSSTPAARKSDFGITDDNEFTQAFVPWLIRQPNITDVQIVEKGNLIPETARTVREYRERAATADDPARQMADVIGAPVIALGKTSGTDKQKYVVTAANDGMVYIFANSGNTYDLALNYLPAGMQRESKLAPSDSASLTVGKAIRATADSNYGKNEATNPHVYLNNGGFAWVRTPKTGGRNQQDILLGTMGQGGRGAYALAIGGNKRDSTNASAAAGLDAPVSGWTTEVPLWETEKGEDNALGYTIGSGSIAQIATQWSGGNPNLDNGVHLYAFVSNGYKAENPDVPYDSSPTLYVYDMMGQEFGRSIDASSSSVSNGNQPGKLIAKLSAGGAEGALATPTLLDSNRDGLADFAYAGDNNGHMYRFDLRGEPSGWSGKVRKIYDGTATQPITSAPAIYKIDNSKFVIIFGTGSDIYDADRSDINQQVVMGVYNDISDENPAAVVHNAGANEIVTQEISEGTNRDGKKVRFLTAKPFNPATHKAWRIELIPGTRLSANQVTTSERVVSKPQILLRTAYLTTRIYGFEKKQSSLPNGADPNQTCFKTTAETNTGGNSWQMAIDTLTGSGPLTGKSSYFKFSDGNSTGVIEAGFDYGHLASATSLVNVSDSSVPKNIDSHGSVRDGEVLPPEKTNPSDPAPNPCTKSARYSLIVSVGKPDDGSGGHNIIETEVECPARFTQGKSLIRVDWRQVPL